MCTMLLEALQKGRMYDVISGPTEGTYMYDVISGPTEGTYVYDVVRGPTEGTYICVRCY